MKNGNDYKALIDPHLFGKKNTQIIENFCHCYLNVIHADQDQGKLLLKQWLQLVIHQMQSPTVFDIYHRAIRSPFDYYQFGLDLIRPLIDFEKSKILGKENLQTIHEQLLKKENVILFANHQTEPDPQIISLLIESAYPELAQKMIFVAGHRVISDPLAVPMSLGRNLLCIYSKKHMSHIPEDRALKIAHNQKTLKKLQDLLNEGGNCIYVAPSGGRDRTNDQNIPEVAPFDPDSLELFRIIGKQNVHFTHFYPLALHTYSLMPPPKKVEKELGETRQVAYSPVQLAFGQKIDWANISTPENLDKQKKRILRANYIYDLVKRDYDLLIC